MKVITDGVFDIEACEWCLTLFGEKESGRRGGIKKSESGEKAGTGRRAREEMRGR